MVVQEPKQMLALHRSVHRVSTTACASEFTSGTLPLRRFDRDLVAHADAAMLNSAIIRSRCRTASATTYAVAPAEISVKSLVGNGQVAGKPRFTKTTVRIIAAVASSAGNSARMYSVVDIPIV